jgi:hypothetical protein
MISKRQGLSRRQYGRHAGITAAYVSKLVGDGKIPTLPDGSLDPAACDAARARHTRVGLGQRRMRRNVPESIGSCSDCHACGELYSVNVSRYYGTQDASRYCSQRCESDAAAGLTRAQVRRKIHREARS